MGCSDIRHAPAADRNRTPILDVLRRVLTASGTALEIASGTGQHVVHFATALPAWHWQPSDPDPEQRTSIRARVDAAAVGNVADPLDLDVLASWPPLHVQAVLAINLLHVAPPAVVPALCAGAAAALDEDGVLVVYGPFRRFGGHTSEGNRRFDAALRARDRDWGLRDVETLTGCAADLGLAEAEVVEMPANNLTVICRRRP